MPLQNDGNWKTIDSPFKFFGNFWKTGLFDVFDLQAMDKDREKQKQMREPETLEGCSYAPEHTFERTVYFIYIITKERVM